MESAGSSAVDLCLDEETLVSLVEGRAEPRTRALAERHVDRCADCRELIAALVRDPVPRSAVVAHSDVLGDLADRFCVERELARGPHGVAVLARSLHDGQWLRIKRIDDALTALSGAARRLENAAIAQTSVVHGNFARVWGCHVSGQRVWIASAFADGDDLGTLVATRAPSRELARDIVTQLVAGLAEAHRRTIVHGHLCAENVIVDLAGQVQITDFSLVPVYSLADGMRADTRAACGIQTEHVVRIFEIGKSETGIPFMVMEHLDGITLGALSARRGPLPVAEAVDIVLQASIAVAECHARGVVHRDLKPDNVMVVERPGGPSFVKLLDFGISKADWCDDTDFARLTDTLDMLGTPTYMSPEQVRSSKRVDSRTDIWALGVISYELLAGRPPFYAPSVPALSAMIVSDEPEPLARVRPDLPPGLAHVIHRCLEKRADRRPQAVRELAEALAPYAAAHSRASVERIRAIAASELPRISTLPPPPISSPVAAPAPVLPEPAAETTEDAMRAWRDTPLRRFSPRALAIVAAVSTALLVTIALAVSALSYAKLAAQQARPDAGASKSR